MAKPKNNRALPLQIPANKGPDSIESRLLALYDQADAKQAFLRELLYSGLVLRQLGVSQPLTDIERSGKLATMSEAQLRETLARMLLGTGFQVSITPPSSSEPEPEEPTDVDASSLTKWGV